MQEELDSIQKEIESCDDVENALDSIVDSIGKTIVTEDNLPAIINIENVKKLSNVFGIMKYLTRGTKSKVTYELHKPFKSMGSVTVTGKQILIRNPDLFLKAIKLSSNFDVYTKTNNTIEMDFTFHGLTNS